MLRTAAALRLAAVLVAAQGVGLVGLAAFYVVELIVATATDIDAAITAAVLVLLTGLGLLQCARGLRDSRRWARAPVLVLQLVAIPVAAGLLQGGRWYIGLPVLLWALAVLVLIFSPGANAEFARREAQR